jgi:hypothetical protein
MRMSSRRAASVFILTCVLLISAAPAQIVDRLPARLTDEEFWKLVTDLSEPGGSFPSPNFVSNELAFQAVLPHLAAGQKPGSGYIGVGPEQNFTYLVAVQPKIAFILDIRRDNLVQHLMYKALFEISSDRAEFLSRLFSRARPPDLDGSSTVQQLFEGFRSVLPSTELLAGNREAIRRHVIEGHGFELSETDLASLDRILAVFNAGGPDLTYGGVYVNPSVPVRIVPTFEELMLEGHGAGMHGSFLATEENFRRIQDLQRKNLIVPVVGNFSGPAALQGIGKYLLDHSATVTAFYMSNVEQYLFRDGSADRFYVNVSTLPHDEGSVIVRALVRNAAGELSPSPLITPATRIELGVFPLRDLVNDHNGGAIGVYMDILKGRF